MTCFVIPNPNHKQTHIHTQYFMFACCVRACVTHTHTHTHTIHTHSCVSTSTVIGSWLSKTFGKSMTLTSSLMAIAPRRQTSSWSNSLRWISRYGRLGRSNVSSLGQSRRYRIRLGGIRGYRCARHFWT